MKMPLGWAKEFAPADFTTHEYAERMTMSGSKVEGFSSEADAIENVVVGKVLELVPHPDSDHMFVCQVDVGAAEPVQIVTGAQNLKVGDLVPAALHKSRLPGGKEIRKGKLRGVESCGMLCSLSELGLTIHDFPNAVEDGIFVLDEVWPTGTPIVEALGMDDVTVEFEITPNRPDCLGVRALGRETAATFGVPFQDHLPQPKPGSGDVNQLLSVSIENTDLCLRYCGAVVENVRIKPSPRWMRQRLRNCGVRPINNLVDITNYVMLEYGQPMHCFDRSFVKGGQIHVRNAKAGEEIVTLDGQRRALSPEMLVIADAESPIAVAGVMGGEFSGTYETTTSVIFESAMFHGPSVRTTSKKLGLRTESSGRYEKGLDPNGCRRALDRALELVQLLDAGDVVNGVVDVFPQPRTNRRVTLAPDSINKLLGTSLTRQEMVDILLPLGFEMDGDEVVCPTWRWDVQRSCDLAEEIARFVGYNNIPSTVMRGSAQARPPPRQNFEEHMSQALAGFGLWETESFSFYSPKCFDLINLPKDSTLRNAVVISNPLGEDTSILRTTALPSVLEVVGRNFAARATECAVFEQATEYLPSQADVEVTEEDFNNYAKLCEKLASHGLTPNALLPTEQQKFVLAAYGSNWDYLTMKGVVEQLAHCAGIYTLRFERNAEGTSYHPGRAAFVYVEDALLGVVGEIHPTVSANYGIKARVVAADLNLDVLFAHRGAQPLYRPLPKHPATSRDLALVADLSMPSAQVADCIRANAGKHLEDLSLFDVYTGDKLEAGKKSLAYKLVFRAADRTLTDEDVDTAVQKVLSKLSDLGVKLRS